MTGESGIEKEEGTFTVIKFVSNLYIPCVYPAHT